MDDSTNLGNLHDLVLPPEVSAWPLTIGWWMLIAVIPGIVAFAGFRVFKQWRSNAYRREALLELSQANDVASIQAILRRCALVITSREEVASKTGESWVVWLETKSGRSASENERRLLALGPYVPRGTDASIGPLKDYAGRWIRGHRATGNHVQ